MQSRMFSLWPRKATLKLCHPIIEEKKSNFRSINYGLKTEQPKFKKFPFNKNNSNNATVHSTGFSSM